jgi:serralysin
MPKINGTNANDVLVGSSDADEISAFAGDDVIYAGAGNDRVITGDGADTVYGADGDDEINGYPSDPLKRDGAYTFWSSSGPLLIYGENGADFIVGSESTDRLYGGAGNDVIYGRGGDDLLDGGDGDDYLDGGEGDNRLFGGAGNDYLNVYLTQGKNYLDGGDGNDSLYGGDSDDTLIGGLGDDYLSGSKGNDRLYGGGGADSLWGGTGDDSLDGGDGDDSLYGSAGNNRLLGGAGNDHLSGAMGNDSIDGGNGDDRLFGLDGDDTLDGGAGYDYLSGGNGDDTYIISDSEFYIYDTGGNDKAIVSVSFVKLPSFIEQVEYINGALPLPYWIDALLGDFGNGTRYRDELLGAEKQFGYTFPKTIPAYDKDPDHALGYTEFNTTQRQNTISFLNYLTGIVDLSFSRTLEPNAPNVLAFALNKQVDSGGYAQYPNSSATGSDVFFNNETYNSTLASGTYGANVLVHEVGHALGLKHPFSAKATTGDIADPPYLTGDEDHARWTMMSYTETSDEYKLTLSPLDIAALQYIYGVSATARSGNDSYAISSSQPNFLWDGNGVDTVDASKLTDRVTLYLTHGYWGFVGAKKADKITAAGQITTNFGTLLENVIGTPYADEIHGNSADNEIAGGAGNDVLYGGAGNDKFDWNPAQRQGNDTFYGGLGNDIFVINALEDLVIEYPDEGNDTVWAALSYSLANLVNVENLYGFGTAALTLTGNHGNNVLTGSSGNDTLDGGDGADSLYGGEGGNRLLGGAGNDYLSATLATGRNYLDGGEGNDSLYGGDSDDTLIGGLGDDYLNGYKGNDTLDGGTGIDIAQYTAKTSVASLTWSRDSWQVKAASADGTDTVKNIELLAFSDRTVDIRSTEHVSYTSISDDLWFFFLAAFNGAPGVTYMDWMVDRTGNGKSIKSFVDVFVTAPQFKDVYPESMSAQQFATKLVANTLKGTAAAVYEQAAVDKILNLMSSGATRSDVIYNAIGDMKWVSASSPIWGKTAQLFEKQKQVAKFYTDIMSQSTTDAATLRSVVANVKYDTDLSTPEKIVELIGVSLLGNFDLLS